MTKTKFVGIIMVTIITLSFFSPALINIELSERSFDKSITSRDDNVIVVMFGDSIEELAALDVIKSSGLKYDLLIYSIGMENKINNYDFIYYIGHGINEGIKNGINIISYNHLNDIVSEGKQIYFIACNSIQDRQNVISFPGVVDAIYAAAYAVINMAIYLGNYKFVIRMLDVLTERTSAILNGAEILSLDYTESGYHVAVRDEYKSGWFYSEHILWINGASSYGTALKDAVSAGYAVVAKISWLKIIAGLLGIPELVVAIVIILMITAFRIGLTIHMGNRIRGDFMIGLGAQLAPYPGFKAWLDNGNDGHGSSWKGWFPISPPDFSAAYWFAAISPLSSNWRRIIS